MSRIDFLTRLVAYYRQQRATMAANPTLAKYTYMVDDALEMAQVSLRREVSLQRDEGE